MWYLMGKCRGRSEREEDIEALYEAIYCRQSGVMEKTEQQQKTLISER